MDRIELYNSIFQTSNITPSFYNEIEKRKGKQGKYPGTFHIGFFIGSEKKVDEIHRRLKQDGFDVPDPENTGHSYGFYVKPPGGFTVEVGA